LAINKLQTAESVAIFDAKSYENWIRSCRRVTTEECIMRSVINCTIHQLLVIISIIVTLTGYVARMGKFINSYKFLSVNPKGRDLVEDLGVDAILMDLTEIGWKYVDWIHLTQAADPWQSFVNTVMSRNVP